MLPYCDDFLLIIHGPSAEVRRAREREAKAVVTAALERLGLTRQPDKGQWEGANWIHHLIEQEDWELVTCDAAGLPFGMVGELRRKLSPIVLLVLLLFMGVDLMDIRVSAVFPSLRQRAAF